jgi:hypothetical protein
LVYISNLDRWSSDPYRWGMAADVQSFDEYDFGFSWVMDDRMQRTSHALVDGARVWAIDPVDRPEAMERMDALGTPAAVLQLLDRHKRDCAAVAERLGVPHLCVPDAVPDSPFEAIPVVRKPGWKETALWWPARRALVVAEAVGTNEAFNVGTGAVGMHPMLRPLPPSALRGMNPEHLLVGHGPGVHGLDAAQDLEHAHARARRDLPRLVPTLARSIIRR